ncbi:MAG: PKD domain-containing protein, partial [Candidatus Hydrogenedentota bacterium]
TGGGANQHVVTAAQDCVIRGFTVSDAGTEGAVFVPESMNCAVTNCVLSDSGKGLLAAAGAEVVFENNTVYNNATYGLRGESGASFGSVQNSIFSMNGTAFSADSGGVASSGYNCFFGNTTDYNGPAAAGTDFSGDPLFVDAASANFHLEAASPCRDAGNPDPSYDDKDGTLNDVGADGGPGGVRDTVAPTVAFTASPLSGDAPLLVEFDATASADEWGIASYSWDFGDNSALQMDTVGTAQHTYTKAETFTVELSVEDNSGLSAQKTKLINVTESGSVEEPPTATADASPRAGVAPFEVQFTGDGNDPDGGDVSFSWIFGDGETSSEQSPVYTYPGSTARGSYEATLTVTDDEDASVQDSLYLTITQEEPLVASEINPGADTSVTVNDGGSAINGAQVIVPTGAVSEPLVVTIGMVPEGGTPNAPRGAVSEVVEVGPEGAAFGSEVTVRIPLSISVPDGSEVRPAVYDEKEGYWRTAGLSDVQFEDGDAVDYLTFKTSHFSFYALFLPPSGTDIDRNGVINAVDVQLAVNALLQLELPPWMDTDVNNSGETGAEDVQLVVNAALGH